MTTTSCCSGKLSKLSDSLTGFRLNKQRQPLAHKLNRDIEKVRPSCIRRYMYQRQAFKSNSAAYESMLMTIWPRKATRARSYIAGSHVEHEANAFGNRNPMLLATSNMHAGRSTTVLPAQTSSNSNPPGRHETCEATASLKTANIST